ncbi:MAG: CpsB/CapC family capsule biosynthesis tyrosine phosphatase [Thermodesulfovibrionales bacterium]
MSSGFIDIHCHILPGLDEGSSTSEESVKMLELAHKDGISGIVATPHIVSGVYNNTKNIIDMAVQELRGLTNHIRIYAGAEIRIARDLTDRVVNNELPLINNKQYLLLELPAFVIPPLPQLENIVRDLIQSKITPIFAHPERNMPILKDLSIMERLIKCGAIFQITAMSITGRNISSSAMKMIKKGYIHVVASDAHDTRNRPPILSPAYETISRKFGRYVADELFISNPQKIVQGENIRKESSS